MTISDVENDVSRPVEVLDGTLFRLGSSVPLDGRVSWAPAMPTHYQPVNCYLLRQKGGFLLIDSGLAVHRRQVLTAAHMILRPQDHLTAFMTRTEMECVGNVGAFQEAFGIDEIIAGGGQNPFDAYEDVAAGVRVPLMRQKLEWAGDTSVKLDGHDNVWLIPSRLRILTTYWLYDAVTKTLFSSDIFGHTSGEDAGQAMLTNVGRDRATRDSIKKHLLTKFSWLTWSRTKALSEWVREIFTSHDIQHIAPTHGYILNGKPLVDRHVGFLIDVLDEVGIERRHG